jgi:hypothetical protein
LGGGEFSGTMMSQIFFTLVSQQCILTSGLTTPHPGGFTVSGVGRRV